MKTRYILLSFVLSAIVSVCLGEERTVPVWTATEFEFQSQKDWTDAQAFNDVTLDVAFTSESGTVLTVPAFWDGGEVWRVRFAPTEPGVWTYKTSCTPDDVGLNGQTGRLKAVPYDGDLEIYRRGFVTTRDGLM